MAEPKLHLLTIPKSSDNHNLRNPEHESDGFNRCAPSIPEFGSPRLRTPNNSIDEAVFYLFLKVLKRAYSLYVGICPFIPIGIELYYRRTTFAACGPRSPSTISNSTS